MVVRREQMTTLMVTHNMEIALRYGNRLVMMHQGKIIVDVEGERKNRWVLSAKVGGPQLSRWSTTLRGPHKKG